MVRRIRTADEFNRWLRRELAIAAVCYFEGNLAQFRKDAQGEVIKLEAEIDRAKPTKPIPPRDRIRLEALRRDMELAQEARRHGEVGNVHLSQVRASAGDGWEYIATRLSRRTTEDY